MKEEELDGIFRELQGHFDLEEPMSGHEQRFLEKLKAGNHKSRLPAGGVVFKWRSYAVAASVVLLCLLGLWVLAPAPSIEQQVAKISPEISRTEFYFANLIEEQIRELENESSPDTQQLVDDTMLQLQKLEISYKKLESDLLHGGNSKLILSAMITNFQTRINLLKVVLEKIDTIKKLKSQNNENLTV